MLNGFSKKSPALRVVFFLRKPLLYPLPTFFEVPKTKTTEATERRIKKMSDKQEAYKVGNSTPSALESALKIKTNGYGSSSSNKIREVGSSDSGFDSQRLSA